MTKAYGDPYAGYRFLLQIDGTTVAGFSTVSGLDTESPILGQDSGLPKIPGVKKIRSIILSNGVAKNRDLEKCYQTTTGKTAPCWSGAIICREESLGIAMTWHFTEGWPARYQESPQDSSADTTGIELLEISCARVDPPSP